MTTPNRETPGLNSLLDMNSIVTCMPSNLSSSASLICRVERMPLHFPHFWHSLQAYGSTYILHFDTFSNWINNEQLLILSLCQIMVKWWPPVFHVHVFHLQMTDWFTLAVSANWAISPLHGSLSLQSHIHVTIISLLISFSWHRRWP